MPLYKSLASGSENEPIVFDIGEAYTKLGFNGEAEPRAVIPTTIDQLGGPSIYILKHDHSTIVGHQAGAPAFNQNVHKFFQKIYFKILQVNPKYHPVVICESLINSTKFRQVVASVLFQQFEVPAILFAPHHLLACFCIGTGTALVLDCSYGESVVIPVVEWTPLIWAWQAAPLGGACLHESIMQSIEKDGTIKVEKSSPQKIDKKLLCESVLEDIKIKACYVTDFDRAKHIKDAKMNLTVNKSGDMLYSIDGKTQLMIPSCVREETAEVLFQKDTDDVSIVTLLLDSLLRCPIDTRKKLAQNLLVIGGTSMLPGFRHRLLFELKETVSSESRYNDVLGGCEFRVHNPPTHPNLVTWLGASIFSTLEEYQKKFVTKEYYDQHDRQLPDWCKCELPMPELVHSRSSTAFHAKPLPSLLRSSLMKKDTLKSGKRADVL